MNRVLDWQVVRDNMTTVGENLDAQRLSEEISKLEVELQDKFNNKPFFDDVHRDVIMKVPTDEGWKVLKHLLSRVSVAKDASVLGKELIMLCTPRWHQLCDLLMMV